MATLFWAALVLGAGLALFSLAGDIFGGDADVETGDALDSGYDAGAFHILTVRNLTYFLMGFGAVGVLLGWLRPGTPPAFTAGIAAATGLLCAAVSALAFGYLRRTASGQMPDDRSLVGLVGNVVLPLVGDAGKIVVQRGGREIELLARPLDGAAENSETWTSVLVVEIRDGIAYVAPYRELIEG
jgi:membrane protein implicated in regulation of membrane protease activity